MAHRKLIDKLQTFGIQGNMLRWIEQFLTARTMRVRVRGSFSDWIKVLSGVCAYHSTKIGLHWHKGAILASLQLTIVLGPLLFLLFVNDLLEWIVGNLKMFADDTKLWITLKSETDSATLQTDLDSFTAWSNRWLLKFNASKCKLMHIGHKFPTEYYMEDSR